MKLPFAVYTARNGFEWICGLDAGLVFLEQLRRTIGKLPEFDFGDPLSCGAVNSGDTVVVYKFMQEKRGDFRGRDSLYLALTYFPRSIAAPINFEELLANTVFATPMRKPPSSLLYESGPSADLGFDFDNIGTEVGLRGAGCLFANLSNATLKLIQAEGSRRCAVKYVPPVEEVDSPEHCEGVITEPVPRTENGSLITQRCRCWGFKVAVALLVVALALVGYMFWKNRFSKDREKEQSVKEALTEDLRSLKKGTQNHE